ncbi:hypothetical protein KY333_02530 [Candidatus Woesearchaeota archaeon]|nr:hypothetical protein [Candidatus Woesearchaeota archaeon]
MLRGEKEVQKRGCSKKEVKAMAVSYKEAQKNSRLGDFILLNEEEI